MYGGDADENALDEVGVRRANLMWSRISGSYPQGIRSVLDIGAGRGWSLKFLREKFPTIRASAIERTPEVRQRLKNTDGIEIVASDISEHWAEKVTGRAFDLIIFRHTLEHMLDPVGALRKIGSALSPEGYAYIVVPNAMSIRKGFPMRTDFFRPVHLHYFNRSTLMAMVERAGLAADILDDEGEVWGLFRRAEYGPGRAAPESPVSAEDQRAYLDLRIRESDAADRKAIGRIALRKLLPAGVRRAIRQIKPT